MNYLAQNPIIGKIEPPATIPTTTDPSGFVASFVRNGLTLMIIAAFVIDLIWTIIAGIRFITAGGDEKTVSSSWSQIYWGLIGMLVVVGAYAIIKLVETFFGVTILTGFSLPRI